MFAIRLANLKASLCSDIAVEGTFAWSDGTPDDFGHWATGEPNDWKSDTSDAGEDAVQLWHRDDTNANGAWNDISGDNLNSFVCETDVSTADSEGQTCVYTAPDTADECNWPCRGNKEESCVAADDNKCSNDVFTSISETCVPDEPGTSCDGYRPGTVTNPSMSCPEGCTLNRAEPAYIGVATPMAWQDAENYCATTFENGHLASIHSQAGQDNAKNACAAVNDETQCWIGLK